LIVEKPAQPTYALRVTKTILLAVLVCAGCGGPSYDYKREPDPRNSEFVIGASDGVKITVWKNPELSTDATVRPDGTVTMPLIGDIKAVGLTPTRLRDLVAQKLAAFVKDETATVTVAVTSIASYRFTVSGNFERPGIFTSKYYVQVAEAIAMAGGINKFANPHKLIIIRPDPASRVRRIPIDCDRVSSGEHPEENLVLLAGDTLYAP
jgi:polysaccharide biosynthesis/export protein